MDRVRLLRIETGKQGTFGILIVGDWTWACWTLELPWRNNQTNISCIPEGNYAATFIKSPTFGPCYWIREVPSRTEILIHTGNLAGDEEYGWKTHSAGCILVGERRGVLGGQEAVLLSRKTLRRFIDRIMGWEDFELEIKEMF